MLSSVFRRQILLRCPHVYCFRGFLFSTSTVGVVSGGNSSLDTHFMVDYLVSSCGFSAASASKASKRLGHLKSTENPDAVIAFMRSQGFDAADLRKLISLRPVILCCNVDKSIAPKFRFFRDMGLSERDLVDAVASYPSIIGLDIDRRILPRLKMWESLLGSREDVFKNIKRKTWFFGNNIENIVRPNLNILRDECGISEERISLVLRQLPGFIVQKPESLRALIARAIEMGASKQSRMFMWTLNVLHKTSKAKMDAHKKLLRDFGCSDSEISTMLTKVPTLLCFSVETLQKKIEFWIREVGVTSSFITVCPMILLLSLKKVGARLRVMKMLKSKGLWNARQKLPNFFFITDTKFLEKFVLSYKGKVPELVHIFREV